MDVFDKLIKNHEVHVASTVIDEVKFFKKADKKHSINLRQQYVENGLIKENNAISDEIEKILKKLPPLSHDTIDAGELESLAILVKEENLTFCSCDAAAIRALPFLDLSERGISAESLLKSSGLRQSKLKDKHTDQYFQANLKIGQENKIYNF